MSFCQIYDSIHRKCRERLGQSLPTWRYCAHIPGYRESVTGARDAVAIRLNALSRLAVGQQIEPPVYTIQERTTRIRYSRIQISFSI